MGTTNLSFWGKSLFWIDYSMAEVDAIVNVASSQMIGGGVER